MRKFLFLDFDGVLNSHLWEISPNYIHEDPSLDPKACAMLLSALVKMPHVEVVIISSYRSEHSLEELRGFLKKHGLDTFVVAKTLSEPVSKHEGIELFLKEQRSNKFIMLDDEIIFDLQHPFHKNQIKTSLYKGLSDSDVEELIQRWESL